VLSTLSHYPNKNVLIIQKKKIQISLQAYNIIAQTNPLYPSDFDTGERNVYSSPFVAECGKDRSLAEYLRWPVVFVVTSTPILNKYGFSLM
jgi:hypothetical protein